MPTKKAFKSAGVTVPLQSEMCNPTVLFVIFIATGQSVGRSVGLVGWLVGWLVGGLVDWWIG